MAILPPDAFGAPAPVSVPLSDLQGAAPGGGGDGGFSSLLSGADAQAELVKGVLAHQLVLGSQATKAASFLYAYGLGDLAAVILQLRQYHQNPKRLMEALESTSLKKFMEGVSVNLSNTK